MFERLSYKMTDFCRVGDLGDGDLTNLYKLLLCIIDFFNLKK